MTDAAAFKSGYQRLEESLPVLEDLEGAARAVMRLQDVYALSVKGLAGGRFQRVSNAQPLPDVYSPGQVFSLSADDCFHIGKVRGPCPCRGSKVWLGRGPSCLGARWLHAHILANPKARQVVAQTTSTLCIRTTPVKDLRWLAESCCCCRPLKTDSEPDSAQGGQRAQGLLPFASRARADSASSSSLPPSLPPPPPR